MDIIPALAVFLIFASVCITGVFWLVKKALDLLAGRRSDSLPISIEEAQSGSMLLHSIDQGAEYIEAFAFDGNPDEYFMEQRAANVLQNKKYTAIEFKDAEGRTHRYDRVVLQQRGWPIY